MAVPDIDFKSPEDLRQVLVYLSNRLHYINRVSRESRYWWQLADLLRATGGMADLMKDDNIGREFGDGWTKGTLPKEAELDRLIELLRERMNA